MQLHIFLAAFTLSNKSIINRCSVYGSHKRDRVLLKVREETPELLTYFTDKNLRVKLIWKIYKLQI